MKINFVAGPDWGALTAKHPELRFLPAETAGVAKLRKLPQGTLLFRQGEQPRNIYYLLDGDVQIVRYARNGDVVVVHRVHGGFFAEASLESPRYHSDAMAVTDAVILAIPMAVYADALDNNAVFRRAHFIAQAREIRVLRSQIERLALPTAQQRIIHYIETEGVNGTVTVVPSLKALAGKLNLSHEALYRTLSGMAKAGLIARDGRVLRRC